MKEYVSKWYFEVIYLVSLPIGNLKIFCFPFPTLTDVAIATDNFAYIWVNISTLFVYTFKTITEGTGLTGESIRWIYVLHAGCTRTFEVLGLYLQKYTILV